MCFFFLTKNSSSIIYSYILLLVFKIEWNILVLLRVSFLISINYFYSILSILAEISNINLYLERVLYSRLCPAVKFLPNLTWIRL